MSNRREFEIAFVGLKPGVHEFEYLINDQFFVAYGEQDFRNCITKVNLTLDKKANFFQLKFDVDGTIEVDCDRCSNTINKVLWDEFNIVVKMVENPDEMNEQEEDADIYYISRNESHLKVADWIYEFINLSVPLQKMCSESEKGGVQCNLEVLEKLETMEKLARNDANSVWKGLDKFKGKGLE